MGLLAYCLSKLVERGSIIGTSAGGHLQVQRRGRVLSSKQRVSTKTILLVEDDQLFRWSINKLFFSLGYRVFGAPTAEEALIILQRERIDLVVTDFQLPAMDGIELTRQLRSLPALREMPVLMISAYRSDETDTQAQQAGITAILSKPVAIEELRRMAEKLLGVMNGS